MLRLLHRAAPPLRGRGLPAHRGRPGVRKHPVLLAMLADGRLHLTAVAKLAPHLTPENRDALLARATHGSKREVEELAAELAPRPDAPALIRKLPEPPAIAPFPTSERSRPDRIAGSDLELRPDAALPRSPRGPHRCPVRAGPGSTKRRVRAPNSVQTESASPGAARGGSPASVQPLSPGRYRVQFTAGAELRDKLERLQALLRSSVPDGDLADVIEDAVTEKLERLEARRFARTKAPRKDLQQTGTKPTSRHIPAAVRRAVPRETVAAAFVDEQGRRCAARDALEFHHRHPFGLGGGHSRRGSPSSAGRTTNSSPKSTTAERPWPGTSGRAPDRRAPGGKPETRRESPESTHNRVAHPFLEAPQTPRAPEQPGVAGTVT